MSYQPNQIEENRRVLLVDDDPGMLYALKRCLDPRFEVHTAENGKMALQILAEGESFAAIVTDMHMPVMGGIELLSRAAELYPATKRIVMTAAVGDETRNQAKRVKAFRYLPKPCSPFHVILLLEEAVTEFQHAVSADQFAGFQPLVAFR